MGLYKYSPDIKDKIAAVCEDPALKINLDFPDLELDMISDFLEKVLHFFKDNFHEIGTREYLIELDFEDEECSTGLTSKLLLTEIKNGMNAFRINTNFCVVEAKRWEQGFSWTSLSNASKNKGSVFVFNKNGLDVAIFSMGIVVHEINVSRPDARPVLNNKFSRSPADYKLSLIDFYQSKVRNNITNHWEDPTKRILKGGKTEDIFQLALSTWLNDNLSGAKIIMKVKKLSKDETDIEIIEHGGNNYLIEIKWLGKNKGKTQYPVAKVESAFHQVINYLEEDKEVLDATITVYDGRAIEDFNLLDCTEEVTGNWKVLREVNGMKLPEKANCYLFHLVSESASVRKSS